MTHSAAQPSFNDVFWWPLAGSLAVTLVVCPVVRRGAVLLSLYDAPDGGLKQHDQPVPYLGGVAMYVGWLVALLTAAAASPAVRAYLPWVVIGGSALMLTGLIDDLRHLPPKLRLLVQAAVAGLLLYGGIGRGTGRALLEPFRGVAPEWMLAEPVTLAFSAAVCMFTIAGASNATNFIDGLDGLCGGIIAIASLGFTALGLVLVGFDAAHDPAGPLRFAVCAAILGACLGFLRYNFNPASIFMGDSGSLLLGYNVAVVLMLFAEQPWHAGYATWRWMDAGLIIFAFPILDTGVAITRRWLNGRPLFVGDRSHLYDQLRDRGLSVRKTVLLCYAIGIVFAVIGVAAARLPTLLLFAALIGVPSLAGIICRRFGLLRVDDAAARSGHVA